MNIGLSIKDMPDWVDRIMMENFTFEELKEMINPNSDINTDDLKKELQQEIEGIHLFDDTISTLERLSKDYRLFVLSNLATPYKEPYYTLGLDKYIEKPFFSCDLGDKKPNASFFQKVIDYSGLDKKNIIMIGDNPISDFKGATDCGIRAILKDNDLTFITKEL